MSTTLFYGGSAALSRAQATLPMLTGIRTEKINIQRDNPRNLAIRGISYDQRTLVLTCSLTILDVIVD